MGFSRQEYWSGLPCLPPGDLPDPGIKLESLLSPALATGSLSLVTPRKARVVYGYLWLWFLWDESDGGWCDLCPAGLWPLPTILALSASLLHRPLPPPAPVRNGPGSASAVTLTTGTSEEISDTTSNSSQYL